MVSPKAVLVSDTHYSLSTKDLADRAWRMAVDKAAELRVPLIDAGDITNDKAIMRAEVIKTMIDTMRYAKHKGVETHLLVGNHSLVNEKSKEHALEFLKPYANVVDQFTKMTHLGMWMIPYRSDLEELKSDLEVIPKDSTIIMHQGIDRAWGGHYVHDKTAAPAEWFKDFRVCSGHYHRRQDIKCGSPRKGAVGLFSYVGSSYSMSWSEASDGPKGFRILMDDGSLEFVPTNLRKHVVIEYDYPQYQWLMEEISNIEMPLPEDLVWMKITGARSELATIDKIRLGNIIRHTNFKLDLIPTDSPEQPKVTEKMNSSEILTNIIDNLKDSQEYKEYMKSLIQEIME